MKKILIILIINLFFFAQTQSLFANCLIKEKCTLLDTLSPYISIQTEQMNSVFLKLVNTDIVAGKFSGTLSGIPIFDGLHHSEIALWIEGLIESGSIPAGLSLLNFDNHPDNWNWKEASGKKGIKIQNWLSYLVKKKLIKNPWWICSFLPGYYEDRYYNDRVLSIDDLENFPIEKLKELSKGVIVSFDFDVFSDVDDPMPSEEEIKTKIRKITKFFKQSKIPILAINLTRSLADTSRNISAYSYVSQSEFIARELTGSLSGILNDKPQIDLAKIKERIVDNKLINIFFDRDSDRYDSKTEQRIFEFLRTEDEIMTEVVKNVDGLKEEEIKQEGYEILRMFNNEEINKEWKSIRVNTWEEFVRIDSIGKYDLHQLFGNILYAAYLRYDLAKKNVNLEDAKRNKDLAQMLFRKVHIIIRAIEIESRQIENEPELSKEQADLRLPLSLEIFPSFNASYNSLLNSI